MPYFSVLMPLYNHEHFVGAAIESIISQSFTDWELIICNDGSTDSSLKIALSYNDDRIIVLNKPNAGCASALNSCLLKSTGKYICWLSSDDIFKRDKLQTHYKNQINNPERLITIAPFGEIKGETYYDLQQAIPKREHRLIHFLRHGNYINGLSLSIERSLYMNHGQFDEHLHYTPDVQRWFTFFKHTTPYYIAGSSQSYSRLGTSSTPGTRYGATIEMPRFLYWELRKKGPECFLPIEIDSLHNTEEVTELLITELLIENNLLSRFFLSDQTELIISSWVRKNNLQEICKSILQKRTTPTTHQGDPLNESISRVIEKSTKEKSTDPITFNEHLNRLFPAIQNEELQSFLKSYINKNY